MNVPGKTSKTDNHKPASAALAAVALQDHLVRSLNLSGIHSLPGRGHQRLKSKLAYRKPQGKSIVKSRVQNNVKSNQHVPTGEKEFVLDKKLAPPTLAQRMGLVEQQRPLLDEGEWSAIKQTASRRDDFTIPCVICKEDIGKLQQVLLSCSHVFHRNCLQAFERFSGKKACPMCRCEQYETRVVHEGSILYRHKCAARIQALWRGHVTRCWYRQMRLTVPPKDPKLRKKFFEEKLHMLTDRLVSALDLGTESLLQTVESNLTHSRMVFQEFDRLHRILTEQDWLNIHAQALERAETTCPICLTDLDETAVKDMPCPPHNRNSDSSYTSNDLQLSDGIHNHVSNPNTQNDPDHGRPFGRLAAAESESVPDGADGCRATSNGEQISAFKVDHRLPILLSCSHVFHHACLKSFEEFASGSNGKLCPVCRSNYVTMPLRD